MLLDLPQFFGISPFVAAPLTFIFINHYSRNCHVALMTLTIGLGIFSLQILYLNHQSRFQQCLHDSNSVYTIPKVLTSLTVQVQKITGDNFIIYPTTIQKQLNWVLNSCFFTELSEINRIFFQSCDDCHYSLSNVKTIS